MGVVLCIPTRSHLKLEYSDIWHYFHVIVLTGFLLCSTWHTKFSADPNLTLFSWLKDLRVIDIYTFLNAVVSIVQKCPRNQAAQTSTIKHQ